MTNVKNIFTAAFWKNIGAMIKSPMGLVSTASTAVTVLGEVGILSAGQSTAITSVLSALLGVIMAFSVTKAHAVIQAKAVKEATDTATKLRFVGEAKPAE